MSLWHICVKRYIFLVRYLYNCFGGEVNRRSPNLGFCNLGYGNFGFCNLGFCSFAPVILVLVIEGFVILPS